MSFLLDTDICSGYLKGNHQLWQRFQQYGGRLHISVITAGELFTWCLRASASPKQLQGVEDLLKTVTIHEVSLDVSRKFAELRAARLDAGQGTRDMDLLIAATALVHNLTLVTHNVQDFTDLPGLVVDDWLAP